MVYDFGGKSHSSPSFSVSRSRNPYYSEAQREEDRKKKQEERAKLEDKVASSRLDIPPSVQKKHPQASKQLWREFRRTIYAHHGKDTVFALDGAIQTNSNSLSLGELVGSGLSMETASQIYSKWDEYWSYTSDIIQNHPLVPNSYPSSESLAEIEQKYIKEEIKEKEDYKVATQKLRESALELYESGNYQVAYAQFQTVTKNAEYFYWNRNSLELNLAKCAIEIGKTEKAKFLADELVKKGYEVGQSNYIRGRAYEKEGSVLAAFQGYESALKAGYSEARADYERVEKILFPESTMPLDEYKMYVAKGGRAIKEGRAVEVVLPAMTLSIPPSVEQADLSGFDESVSQKKDKEQKTTLEIGVNQKENTKDSKDSKVAPEETTKIVNTSDTGVAVPGTKITYGLDLGDRIEPRDYFTYKWRIKNDLSKVNENSGIFSAKRHPMFVDLGVSKKGKVDVEWDFPGNHTIEVEVYNQGSLESSHSIKQVVQDAGQHAKDAFAENTPPKMQGDVYLTWLSSQKQLALSQGAEEKQLQQIERAIANATELLGVSNDNPSGEAIPISATLVPKAEPQPAPLQLYVKPIESGWAIVDLTNPDSASARTYEGKIRTTSRQADLLEGESAKGSLEAAAVPEGNVESPEAIAIERAWNNFVQNNPHPAGEIVAQFPGELIVGENQTLQAHSDGVSTLGKVRDWFSSVGLVAGLGGLALTVATGGVGTVAVGLFIAASASGVVAGGSNIADRVKHGNFEWDGETALDLVDIAGGLAGGTTAILSLGAKAANITKLRNAMVLGEAVETSSDVAGGVILGAQYLTQIEQIKSDPNLTPEQKKEQISGVLAAAAATGGLMVLGTAAGVKTKTNKGTDVDVDVDVDTSQGNRTFGNVADTNNNRTTNTDVRNSAASRTNNLAPDSPLARALPQELQGKVRIVVDESLNDATVRAYYKPEVHIKVGTKASAVDIQLHVPTLRTLQRYAGLTGKVRALVERIANWIKRNGEPPVGSLAWEAKLELEKLPTIIEARQARLASGDIDAATRTQLEAEIADLEEQIAYHTRKLDAMDINPGVGYVASEGYVELHNHLNGVLEPEELLSIAYSRVSEDGTQITDYKQYLSDLQESYDTKKTKTLSEDQKYFNKILNGRDINSLNQEQAQQISQQLLTSKSIDGQQGTKFDRAYAYRRTITKTLVRNQKTPDLYQKIIQKLKSQGINYIELQGAIHNNKAAREKVSEILTAEGIDVRFLRNISTGKILSSGSTKKTVNYVEDQITKAVEGIKKGYREVGIDIAGAEREFKLSGMERFESLYEQLKEASLELGRPLVLRIHVGEGYPRPRTSHREDAKNNVQMLTQRLQKMQNEGKLDPEKVILRYGHATHASFEDLEKIKELGVIVEANLRSNVTTGSVRNDDETQQTLLKFLYHDINTIINTDGGGVMGTTLPEEYRLAKRGIEKFKNNEIGIPEHQNTNIYYYDEMPDLNNLEPDDDYLYMDYEHKLIPFEKKANFEFKKLKDNSDYYRDNITPRITEENNN